jgi:hypothetical protein
MDQRASRPGGAGPVTLELTLDGVAAGTVAGFEGGDATGDLVEEPVGRGGLVRKHIAGVKYRRGGSIDMHGRSSTTRLVFTDALISEIGMPALDAASKDAATMTVKLSPSTTRRETGGAAAKPAVSRQKTWLPSNFRLEIAGLDCTKVSAVGALTIRQRTGDEPDRRHQQEPAHLEIPNLVVELAEASGASFLDYFEDFVIRGNNGADTEKAGTLAYLGPDGKPLFTLAFSGLGIFRLRAGRVEANSESVRRVRAEMYCEAIKLTQFPS